MAERYCEVVDIQAINKAIRPDNAPSRGPALDRRLGALSGLTVRIDG